MSRFKALIEMNEPSLRFTSMENETELIFIGYGFSGQGPYFVFDDLNFENRMALLISSRIMTLDKTDRRYCIGAYNLATLTSKSCKYHFEMDGKHKNNRCNNCQYEIGFNPAFYNSSKISPQQAEYNNQPHVVYMAYFAPNYVKAGIASKKRYPIRLLEQGARAAIVLSEFPNASMARELEAGLCSNDAIYENLTSIKKQNLIIDEEYNFNKAKEILSTYIEQYCLNDMTYRHNDMAGNIIDLQPFYYADKTKSRVRRLEDQKTAQISGMIKGMIGDNVIVEQNGLCYAISIKKYISHRVHYCPNQVKHVYKPEPTQLNLWDY